MTIHSLKKINVVLCTRTRGTRFTQTPVNTFVACDLLPNPFMGGICFAHLLSSLDLCLFILPSHTRKIASKLGLIVLTLCMYRAISNVL